MTGEIVGIVVFSIFMFGLVGVLVGNLFVALYRERRLRKAQSRTAGGGLRTSDASDDPRL